MYFLLFYCLPYCFGCKNNPYIKDTGPLVTTAAGSVAGTYVNEHGDSPVAAFLGIPFAEPPVNDKRFQKPKPLDHWDGILDATKKPSPCMQHSERNFSWIPTSTPSEDCLYLNVWTPVKCCCNGPNKLPVLVWIYGGGFAAGSTDMEVYDGSTVAAQEKVIVVSMNYRVGIFGFLKSGAGEAPGNVGLLDQILALKWIKRNIEYFGGDPQSITLMGESAGAVSVSLHMISPMSRNLFHRAILQSASAYQPQMVDNAKVAFMKADNYAKVLGCITENSSIETDPEVFKCLNSKSSWELAKAEAAITSRLPQYFLPTHGDDILPVSPIKAIDENHFAPVDILIGNNRDEVTIFLNYMVPDVFKLDSEPHLDLPTAQYILGKLFESAPNVPPKAVIEYYFKNVTEEDSTELVNAIVHAFGDYVFNCPVKFLAEKASNAYVYWYTHKSANDPNAEWVGVPHFNEVPYVFGSPIRNSDSYTEEDGKFSKDLIQKWITFATKGCVFYYLFMCDHF